MPVPLLALGGLGAILTQVLRYVFLAHLAGFVIRCFALLGLTWFTNELIVENVLSLIQSRMQGMPGDFAMWLDALEIDKVISILASAFTLLGAKRLFLGKSA